MIAERQIEILKVLLDEGMPTPDLCYKRVQRTYERLKSPTPGFIRDVKALVHLGAVVLTPRGEKKDQFWLEANLDWPREITESEFIERVKSVPKAKAHSFLSFM